MLTLEVKIRPGDDLLLVEDLVQDLCQSRGLKVSSKRMLASYPGSVHWHFRKADEPGTLEVTFWRDGRRLWISVHANRRGAWTAAEARRLKSSLQTGLGRIS